MILTPSLSSTYATFARGEPAAPEARFRIGTRNRPPAIGGAFPSERPVGKIPVVMNPTPSQPATQRVADLRKGDRVRGAVYLVEVSNFKQTRNQKYFLQLVLRDATGSLRAVRWEATEELYRSFGVDDFVRVDGRVEEFQGNRQLVVDRIEREEADTIDYSQFLPACPRPVEELELELRQAIGEMRRPELKALLLAILDDPAVHPGLLRCPAGKSLHHAYVGGLLDHICSLISAARELCRHYGQLDRDILYAAAVLHDIGKIEELSYSTNFSYTDIGQLVGHIGIGISLVREKARAIDGFPPDLLLELLHIIASHHGIPEHGALKRPMTAEAIAFEHLDSLDAKLSTLEIVERELPPDEGSDGPRWSDYKPHLERKIFFPRPLTRGDGYAAE